MSTAASGVLTLHFWRRSRAYRVLWLYYELEAAYSKGRPRPLPEMRIEDIDPVKFRTDKSEEFLELNPNGKVKFKSISFFQSRRRRWN